MGSDRPHTHTQMRPSGQKALRVLLAVILTVAAFPSQAEAHAFPVRSEPRVGWTIPNSPSKVTIWFDGELEPAFSKIAVYNSAKQRVDTGNARVNSSNATLLEVDLSHLPPGIYRVYWSVVAKDTHRTDGDFSFTIEAKSP